MLGCKNQSWTSNLAPLLRHGLNQRTSPDYLSGTAVQEHVQAVCPGCILSCGYWDNSMPNDFFFFFMKKDALGTDKQNVEFSIWLWSFWIPKNRPYNLVLMCLNQCFFRLLNMSYTAFQRLLHPLFFKLLQWFFLSLSVYFHLPIILVAWLI